MHPLNVPSRPCFPEVLLSPHPATLQQQELFLTAQGTSGTYQPTGHCASVIVFDETLTRFRNQLCSGLAIPSSHVSPELTQGIGLYPP